MKSKLSIAMQRSLLTATLLAILAFLAPARGAEVDDNIYNYLQVLRSDFNSAKVELINKIMKLSADEAQKFWPIYRQYENELAQMAVGRAELIAEFVKSHQDGTFDNPRADDIASRWFKGQRARLDLMEKYHKKVKKMLTPIRAGQFLQIEHQLGIFIDMTIAAEMPLVGEQKK
jgi:hypothetical protein